MSNFFAMLGAKSSSSAFPHSSASFSSPSSHSGFEGVFVLDETDFRNPTGWLQQRMRGELFSLICSSREEIFLRNAVLLKAANINVHDTAHQDRDAQMVHLIFQAFRDKLDPEMLEPALAAAMTHDSEYIQAARDYATIQLRKIEEPVVYSSEESSNLDRKRCENRKQWQQFLDTLKLVETAPIDEIQHAWSDSPFPQSLDKKALDPHAQLGAERIRREFDDPRFIDAYSSWNEKQRTIAEISIRDHSNGSAYNPYEALEAQVLRFADKLDNIFSRVDSVMLSERTLSDDFQCHRFVPTAIRSQRLEINRILKSCCIHYAVDPFAVEKSMKQHYPDFVYNKDDFLVQFEEAYGRSSMPAAAEVYSKLEAAPDQLYNDEAKFEVEFTFPDQASERRRYQRAIAPPVFK